MSETPCSRTITAHLGPGCEACAGSGMVCDDHDLAHPFDGPFACDAGCFRPCPACTPTCDECGRRPL